MNVARQARADRITAALDKPRTAAGIVKQSKLGRTTVWRWLTRMHDAGDIHIFDWAPELGGPVPVYARGPGVDAECDIVPATAQQRTEKCRRRQRQSAAYHKRVDDARRAQALEQAGRASYHDDPLLSALFVR